ncbi:MAG: sulfate ABC transporter ATP-binding protein [Cyanobacteria bacterium WB6_1B_304]|nr:sulfate ABC transporter ATP-binding protein [Cyanobacteria bacterium WB6_1B_304]
MGISIENVSKRFGLFQAIDEVSLEIKTGSLVALLGPSGSGKSTLLRMIAGLETPDTGRISLVGEDATHRSVQERNIGFVFQHYALFKHLTVRRNIAFALEIRKVPTVQIKQRVQELLELIQLEGLGDRYPSQLSGGQRQRVALARALAFQPQVLLLDEPFGALDAKVRKELRLWLRHLHDTVNVTTVFVTHDQEEAMEVASELVVMNKGRIEQSGSPADIYENPNTPFVMGFIGPVNVLPAHTDELITHHSKAETPHSAKEPAHLFLRPHDILIYLEPGEDRIPATIERVIHLGWEVQVELSLTSGQTLIANLTRDSLEELQPKSGQGVFISPRRIKLFSGVAA